MRDNSVLPLLVFVALALMLSFVPRKLAALSIALSVFASFLPIMLHWNIGPADRVAIACSVIVALLAIRTYWPRPGLSGLTIGFAITSGFIAGAAISVGSSTSNLWPPMAATALVVPALIAIERGYSIAPRVVMSWLLAVTALAAVLPYVVKHPGYVSDHRE
jgi:hypothetical protein